MHVDFDIRPTERRLRRALKTTGCAVLCAAAALAGGTGVAAAGGQAGFDPTVQKPAASIAGGQGGFDPTAQDPGLSIAGGQGGLDPTAQNPGASIAGANIGVDPSGR